MPSEQTKFRTAYAERVRISKTFETPSLAKQAERDVCDINRIMARYVKTGLIEHTQKHGGVYDDIAGVQDYHTSMLQILAAEKAFMSIPASVRKKFNNDPGEFLEFAQNPENLSEMVEMGLAPAPRDLEAERLSAEATQALHEETHPDGS